MVHAKEWIRYHHCLTVDKLILFIRILYCIVFINKYTVKIIPFSDFNLKKFSVGFCFATRFVYTMHNRGVSSEEDNFMSTFVMNVRSRQMKGFGEKPLERSYTLYTWLEVLQLLQCFWLVHLNKKNVL